MTQDKVRKLRTLLRAALCDRVLPARKLARITGQCVSMTRAIAPGQLLLRNVYRVLASRLDWSSSVTLDAASIADLSWWLEALNTWNGAPLCQREVEVQVATDASSIGWGGTWIDQQHHAVGTCTGFNIPTPESCEQCGSPSSPCCPTSEERVCKFSQTM